MIYAKNNIEVTNEQYSESRYYLLDRDVFANKLTIQLLAANRKEEFVYGPVILQVTERPEHTFEDDLNTEQFLELGFNARGYVTPITAFRVRVPGILDGVEKVKPALLHFVFYG